MKRIAKVLLVIGFIGLYGLLGRMEMQDEIRTHIIDEQNKQEVIKDIQLRCYTGELSSEMCKGL